MLIDLTLQLGLDMQSKMRNRQELPKCLDICTSQNPESCNLTYAQTFHLLSFQQFRVLLTFFPKSFSHFPHGTCLLSVSSLYLALDEIYHPLYAPIPRNATLRTCTVHGGLQMKHRILTHVDALFQEAYTCASVGTMSRGYNPRPRPQFPSRAHPCSFAITKGILFSSFSSAYLYA